MTNPALDFDVDTLSGMAPLRPVTYSLGSNLGDRMEYLQTAVNLLRMTPGLKITGVSSVYETDPVGLLDQPDFLNIVVLADSTLASTVMLERAHAIEDGLERVRTVVNGPRTIDIDLIAVGDRVLGNEFITLPHPRAHQRAFVLVPWLELDPAAHLVGRGRVADLVAGLDTSGVRRRDDLVIEL
ncbi:MAG: 2-amino-4-hydroxy-6-hydroxymethyldihydropteridine diphosphokinase [Propionicimonas sp.]|uniref:2-amino-4-hydroxy-6- hydroxymethyldihydropteridine diphosphokinase n=1 Tax=Propionicimonas sp. TaxID=1955623 RepID=UPI002B1F86DC|nr:2-amino-4-hydroxy-6-hydroxymethyldihydropteridine diphosphokinase [Propionicimonas sp.]MEA4944902.1 2-amino-4-hydroxy-6-hydroxymethyldihydropteridine diphosphokinase [Propionicimonas sp.]MEA5055416.1 2-amino-4-hydroxy-6-hydroxymethyldihydropteridine diphosphokinase [Propionicimonas sp.]MEA5119586.1 2-amino-4-hydroxy-6-hydroxymethyldihydropteridine diphosphokinase [Propionicimonas sp.]